MKKMGKSMGIGPLNTDKHLSFFFSLYIYIEIKRYHNQYNKTFMISIYIEIQNRLHSKIITILTYNRQIFEFFAAIF